MWCLLFFDHKTGLGSLASKWNNASYLTQCSLSSLSLALALSLSLHQTEPVINLKLYLTLSVVCFNIVRRSGNLGSRVKWLANGGSFDRCARAWLVLLIAASCGWAGVTAETRRERLAVIYAMQRTLWMTLYEWAAYGGMQSCDNVALPWVALHHHCDACRSYVGVDVKYINRPQADTRRMITRQARQCTVAIVSDNDDKTLTLVSFSLSLSLSLHMTGYIEYSDILLLCIVGYLEIWLIARASDRYRRHLLNAAVTSLHSKD